MKSNIKWKFTKDTPSIENINEIEEKFDIKLPEDYLECIKENNGGRPRPKIFDLKDEKEKVLNSLLSILKKDKENILDVYEWISDRLPDNTYPFASDSFGNYICFFYDKSDISVVFWNHEKASKNKKESISFVCDTFTQLLDKLYYIE